MLKSLLSGSSLLSNTKAKRVVRTGSQTKNQPGENTPNKSTARPDPVKKRLNTRESVPAFDSVISAPGGAIELTASVRRRYIVLNKDKGGTKAYVLSSSPLSTGVDNTFLTIKERCRRNGLTAEEIPCTKDLVDILYEEHASIAQKASGPENKSQYRLEFQRLIEECFELQTSDIHIFVRPRESPVKIRRHGDMTLLKEWSNSFAHGMCTVIYDVIADSAQKDVAFNPRIQQSARVEMGVGDIKVAIRLNTSPVSGGYDMVLRLIEMDHEKALSANVQDLGYSASQLKVITRALLKPQGVLLISGTTGSGKSQSLATMLNSKIRAHYGPTGPTIKVITVEDPTEYLIPDASQIGVVRKKEDTDRDNAFAHAIKSALRQDPDILMVGEVRDKDTAGLLVQAVQSGHTVMSTTHAGSAIGTVQRLRGFGVSSDVLGGGQFLSCLINQSLVPVLCDGCKIPASQYFDSNNEDEDKVEMMNRLIKVSEGRDISGVYFRNWKGCPGGHNGECVNGVVGRTVIAEVIEPNLQMRTAFEAGKDSLATYYHLKRGGELLAHHAIRRIFDGQCDPFQAELRAGPLDDIPDIADIEKTLFGEASTDHDNQPGGSVKKGQEDVHSGAGQSESLESDFFKIFSPKDQPKPEGVNPKTVMPEGNAKILSLHENNRDDQDEPSK